MSASTTPFPTEYISSLGHGSYGVVLKARNIITGSHSAVKILFPSNNQKEDKYLDRESEILKGKSHPNIVQVINIFETTYTNVKELKKIAELVIDDEMLGRLDAYMGKIIRKKTLPAILIEMELCGETLREWLKQHLMDNKKNLILQITQVHIIKDMISGMKFLHDNKIIHRDFKPENIMFSSSLKVDKFPFPLKIGDFGLSRILHSENSKTSTLTSRMGSMDYMAPEMNGNEYNFQSDIYSLGLVIWEVVQLIPFNGRKKMFADLVLAEKIELVVSFLPSISTTIIHMTKRKLEERIKSIVEVEIIFEDLNNFNDEKSKLSVDYNGQLEPRTYEAKNGIQFTQMLLQCVPGDTINLTEGEFEGCFEVECSDIKINGKGNKTVIHSNEGTSITIYGKNCVFSNAYVKYSSKAIYIKGSNNSIRNIDIMNFGFVSTGLLISGNNNNVSEFKVFDSVQDGHKLRGIDSSGINIDGSNNILENIEINDTRIGIQISNSNNAVNNFVCKGTFWGVYISGTLNRLSTIKYIISKPNSSVKIARHFGVKVSGSGHVIEDLQCNGLEIGDCGVQFERNLFASTNCIVNNSCCGPLEIWGSKHIFYNIECGPCIELFGDGHTITKCKGKLLVTHDKFQSQKLDLCENSFEEKKCL